LKKWHLAVSIKCEPGTQRRIPLFGKHQKRFRNQNHSDQPISRCAQLLHETLQRGNSVPGEKAVTHERASLSLHEAPPNVAPKMKPRCQLKNV